MYKKALGGWLAPTPEPQPSTLDETIRQAMTEHLKFHSDDGLQLFIWATPAVTGDRIYIYPSSAVDADVALEMAMRDHETRGIQPSGLWELLFPEGEHHLVVVCY
jgi:hypothetical protein